MTIADRLALFETEEEKYKQNIERVLKEQVPKKKREIIEAIQNEIWERDGRTKMIMEFA